MIAFLLALFMHVVLPADGTGPIGGKPIPPLPVVTMYDGTGPIGG